MSPWILIAVLLAVMAALAVGYWMGKYLSQGQQAQQKDTFKALAGDVLAESTTEFLKLAEEKLIYELQVKI